MEITSNTIKTVHELTKYNKMVATTMRMMPTTMGTMITHASTLSSELSVLKFGGTPCRIA